MPPTHQYGNWLVLCFSAPNSSSRTLRVVHLANWSQHPSPQSMRLSPAVTASRVTLKSMDLLFSVPHYLQRLLSFSCSTEAKECRQTHPNSVGSENLLLPTSSLASFWLEANNPYWKLHSWVPTAWSWQSSSSCPHLWSIVRQEDSACFLRGVSSTISEE